jgi:hypothetical protein
MAPVQSHMPASSERWSRNPHLRTKPWDRGFQCSYEFSQARHIACKVAKRQILQSGLCLLSGAGVLQFSAEGSAESANEASSVSSPVSDSDLISVRGQLGDQDAIDWTKQDSRCGALAHVSTQLTQCIHGCQ